LANIENQAPNLKDNFDPDEERFNNLTEANWEAISEMITERLLRPQLVIDNTTVVGCALTYAERGWHVFPSPPGEKKGIYGASPSNGNRPWGMTMNAAEIRHYWREHPNANVCIVTGAVSGIFVVETDTAAGHGDGVDGAAELAKLEAQHGALPATLEAISPSGSVHRYYRHPGADIKVMSRSIAKGIDCKGDGGMVVGPPSVKPGKGVYAWRNDLPIAEAPQWLLKLVAKEPVQSISQAAAARVKRPTGGSSGFSRPYLDAVMREEIDLVTGATKGDRNRQLNKSTFNLAQFVGAGALTEDEVEDAMLSAAIACGLHRDDGGGLAACKRTIASGMKDGKASPRQPRQNIQDDDNVTDSAGIADDDLDTRDANVAAPSTDLPTLEIKDGELSRLATKAEQLLIAAGVPVYQRGGTLVRPIIETVDATRGRKTKVAQLRTLDAVYLRDLFSRYAIWQRYDGRSKKMAVTNPPAETAATVLARAGDWNFKAINGVISTPTMRPDGSLLTEQGFDEQTGLLLVEPPPMPTIPEKPTKEDAEKALALLEDLLPGFPFVDDVSKSVALSAIMTPIARGAFSVTPMHASRAPAAGSGKSFLWDIVAAIAIGQPMPVMSAGDDTAELEKRLGAALLAGQPLISIDNISGELRGDKLCQVIERPVVEIRILGRSENVRIEGRGTSTYSTGINFVIAGDLTRRVITVNLDPQMERPELRQFAFDPVDRVLADRGKYIAAVLTICGAYVVAGRPGLVPRLASFEGWSDTVRSALVWLGKADPVLSMEAAKAEDPERIELSNLLEGWAEALGLGMENRMKLATVVMRGLETTRVQEGAPLEPTHPDLYAALVAVGFKATGRHGQQPDAAMLGQYLRKFNGTIVDGKRLANRSKGKGGSEWWVEEVVSRDDA
jgi:hypothetical protein